VAYGIVTQSGGSIFVDSTVGRGTTVTVAFTRESPVQADAVSIP
jgi:signal transduction histidine kinase